MKNFLRLLRIKWVTPTNVKSLMVAAAAVLLATGLFLTGFLKQLDYYWLNFITVTYSIEKSEEKRIAIVEILDRTYEVCGSSITREMYLKCLQHIEELGARVIAFDIFFRAASSKETDTKFAELSREHNNILFIINREGTSEAFMEPRFPPHMKKRLIMTHPLLNKDAHETSEIIRGFSAFHPRPGRILVHQDRTEEYLSENLYYALPLMAAARYKGVEIELLPQDPPAQRRPFYLPGGLTLKMGKELYYLAGDRLFITYPRMKRVSIETYSFEQIIADNFRELIPPGALNDRIVIVGNNSSFFHDMHRTPIGLRSGSEIHSICISNILNRDLLYPLNRGTIITLIILMGMLSLASFPHLKPMNSFSVFICLIAAIIISSILLFKYGRIFLDLTPLLLVVLLSYPVMSLFKTRETELELDTSLAIFDNLNILDRSRSKGARWLSTILSLCGNSIKASGGWIQTIDEKGSFTVDAVFNMSGRASANDLEGGLCRKVVEKNTLILSRNLALEPELSPYEQAQEFYNLLCVPLPGSNGTQGVMVLGKKFMDEFKENQVRQIVAIALITGAFIENVSLNIKLEEVFLDTIASLAQAIDARDPYTYGHSKRVSEISGQIAAMLRQTPEEAHRIEVAGILHDIGKIGVPESILQKPGKLTDEEFASMKKHPEVAVKILEPLDQFYSLLPLVAGHHEKLNGRGYPQGLQGEEIPFGARILAVADVYDALTSDRPYRKASTPEEALTLMEKQFKGDLDDNALKALREYLAQTGEL